MRQELFATNSSQQAQLRTAKLQIETRNHQPRHHPIVPVTGILEAANAVRKLKSLLLMMRRPKDQQLYREGASVFILLLGVKNACTKRAST
jgi:hypothetical protein